MLDFGLNLKCVQYEQFEMLLTAEILTAVLSMYMYEHGANLPLPCADEVLLCNANTTAEDVC